MNKQDRVNLLNNLKEQQETKEAKLINYAGRKQILKVYDIPLEALVYNPYNGRIKAQSTSWEYLSKRKLDPENADDVLLIERFLWESTKYFNQQTQQSLSFYGQIEPGIVTADGVIIDGNRRACLLNILNRKDGASYSFKAIILPDELADNPKLIVELETIYQMGIDPKVDYNPIEKYLRLDELFEFNFTRQQISEMLSVSVSEIEKWNQIFDLMKRYLMKYGYTKLFVGLDKREGHFVDLRNYLNSYRHGVGRDNSDWAYSEEDLEAMIDTYADYTRMRYPVQNCRIISNPSKSSSIFCHDEIWKEFRKDHLEIVSSVNEEPITEYVNHYKNEKSIEELVFMRDERWSNTVREPLIENFFSHKRVLEDKLKMVQPLNTLISAKKTIQTINIANVRARRNVEIDVTANDIIELVKEIQTANYSN